MTFKKFFLFTLFIIILLPAFGQQPFWSVGTAKTLPKNNLEVSVFEKSRYGLTKSIELSAHPLAFFIIPHIDVKKMWINTIRPNDAKFWPKHRLIFSTNHGINYPSILLKTARNTQFMHLLPRDSVIPGILAFKNEALFSTFLKPRTSCTPDDYLLTMKIGTKYAFPFKKDTVLPIDKSVLYRETSIYQKKLLWYVGADLEAALTENFNYSVDIDFYSVRLAVERWSVEHKGLIIWQMTQRIRACAGYKLAYSQLATRNKFFIMPLVDFTWTFAFKNASSLNLFEDGIYAPQDDRSDYMK
jgi:hypothetical protein